MTNYIIIILDLAQIICFFMMGFLIGRLFEIRQRKKELMELKKVLQNLLKWAENRVK
jgi:hypothetical protein